MPKPTYVVQSVVKKILAIPKTNIKAPNTICALANPRKAVALYTMTVIKIGEKSNIRSYAKKFKASKYFLSNISI